MFDFKLEDIEDVGYELLPKGVYPVQVENAEVKDTATGEGKYISVELTVLGEEHAGRKIFDIFNVVNKSEKAENIGKGQLKQLIIASGADIEIFTGPEQLIGLECDAVVKIKTSAEYDDRNEIKKYQAQTDGVDIETGEITEETSAVDSPAEGADAFD